MTTRADRVEGGKKLPVISDNARPDFCGPCGGKCCKGMPGACLPSDFGSTPEEMRERLTSALLAGTHTIDYWEGDFEHEGAEIYQPEYVRAPIKGHEGRHRHGGWGGSCALLTDTGCRLSFADRPTQCRALVPTGVGLCDMPNEYQGKEPFIVAWLPYADVISGALSDARTPNPAAPTGD